MVQFELRKPIETRSPRIEVDPGLPPGTYRFSLVVTDDAGNESQPDIHTLVIQGRSPVRDRLGEISRERERQAREQQERDNPRDNNPQNNNPRDNGVRNFFRNRLGNRFRNR